MKIDEKGERGERGKIDDKDKVTLESFPWTLEKRF